jgi:RNA polymerase-binding transcription factor DksA
MIMFHDKEFEAQIVKLEETLRAVRTKIKESKEQDSENLEFQQMAEYYEWASLMDALYKNLAEFEIDQKRRERLERLLAGFWEDNK